MIARCVLFLMLLLAAACPGRGQTVPVLMLSDLHFDPFHDPVKVAELAAAPISGWDAILGRADSPNMAADFASIQQACGARGVDSDYRLLVAALLTAQQQASPASGKSASFVTVTGDLLVHNFDCRYDVAMHHQGGDYAPFAEKTANYVMLKVETAFARMPVYFANGNNDSSCGDYRMDVNDRYLKATSRSVMEGLRGASEAEVKRARQTYEEAGNFAVTLKLPHRTRLLVLNDIYLSAKYSGCAGKKDGAGAEAAIAWLDRELKAAKADGEGVWVVGHIPPGVDAYATLSKLQNICTSGRVTMFLESDRLAETLERHADVVRLGLFAHTHSDEVRLLQGAAGKVPVKLVSSVSPVNGNRPSFTLAQADIRTGKLVDYTVFVSQNETGVGVPWPREYSFRTAYREPDFSGSAVAELVGRLQADRTGAGRASRTYERLFAPGVLPVLILVWPRYGCALSNVTEDTFKACICNR